jgi:hypothetical protein
MILGLSFLSLKPTYIWLQVGHAISYMGWIWFVARKKSSIQTTSETHQLNGGRKGALLKEQSGLKMKTLLPTVLLTSS